MKLSSVSTSSTSFAMALLLATSGSTLFAQGSNRGGFVPVRTAEHARQTSPKTQVKLACADCQTVAVAQPKGIRAWFTPNTRHECPGCKETMTFTGSPGRSANTPKLTHSCSICGKAAASLCANH